MEALLLQLEKDYNVIQKTEMMLIQRHDENTHWVEEKLIEVDSFDAIINRSLIEMKNPQSLWDEEEETIKMLSWYAIVEDTNKRKEEINTKMLCDTAHPLWTHIDGSEKQQIHVIMRSLIKQTHTLLQILQRYHADAMTFEFDLAKELLRVQTLKLWKTIRVVKIVCCSERTMKTILQLPNYCGEDKWNHPINEKWHLDIVIRDSPIVDTLTLGCICIIGLLCASATVDKITSRKEILEMMRAENLLTRYVNSVKE